MAGESDPVQFMLGEITGRLNAQDDRHARMERMQAQHGAKLDKIVGYIERDKGARRATGVIASGLGVVAGIVAGWLGSRN